jgi:hypothetical protein
VVLCTPAVIGEKNDFSNPQDGDMNHYSNLIRKLAEKIACHWSTLEKRFWLMTYPIIRRIKIQVF